MPENETNKEKPIASTLLRRVTEIIVERNALGQLITRRRRKKKI